MISVKNLQKLADFRAFATISMSISKFHDFSFEFFENEKNSRKNQQEICEEMIKNEEKKEKKQLFEKKKKKIEKNHSSFSCSHTFLTSQSSSYIMPTKLDVFGNLQFNSSTDNDSQNQQSAEDGDVTACFVLPSPSSFSKLTLLDEIMQENDDCFKEFLDKAREDFKQRWENPAQPRKKSHYN
ncbi:unnamed protein product [Caenorhabditis angaria]|uniref:Uncharacterized protein n=1 Tax=Caenorhabditis angaria TaxID=860376 RepID=A0A9P1I8J6_9PELO|nr:unnamed protein product [Caenorhabditis angaria]